jgi:signal transduction histidine kinase
VRLKTKLTLAFALVAVVPIFGVSVVAHTLIAHSYQLNFRRTLEEAQAEAEREFAREAGEIEATTARLGRADEPMVGALLLELAKGPLEDEDERDLQAKVAALLNTTGLDILELTDERGQVLAAGHFPGRVGEVDQQALELIARAGERARLGPEHVLEGGRVRPVLALLCARTVVATFGEQRQRVVVVGGRRFDQRFLDRLHVSARLLSPEGAVLEAGRDPSRFSGRAVLRALDFQGLTGEPAARVELAVSSDELERTLQEIRWAALAWGLGGLLSAILLGALVASGVSRPLGEVADAVQAVARGQLDTVVPVRGSKEMAELADTFNAMTRDLSRAREELLRAERLAAWREIAQRIAHEIKNPLTPIQMAIETLKRVRSGPRAGALSFDELFEESSRTILEEVERLKHIVHEFSSFARMPQPQLEPLDLNGLVDGQLALYVGGEVAVERDLAPERPFALADRDQVQQVLLNLLENARDAAQAGGRPPRLIVRTRTARHRVELEVEDNGAGLTEEVRAKIFTPYFTTKARGTGLGLAIVHRIVVDHGGEIHVGGAPGEGAVFTVSLPAGDPSAFTVFSGGRR